MLWVTRNLKENVERRCRVKHQLFQMSILLCIKPKVKLFFDSKSNLKNLLQDTHP